MKAILLFVAAKLFSVGFAGNCFSHGGRGSNTCPAESDAEEICLSRTLYLQKPLAPFAADGYEAAAKKCSTLCFIEIMEYHAMKAQLNMFIPPAIDCRVDTVCVWAYFRVIPMDRTRQRIAHENHMLLKEQEHANQLTRDRACTLLGFLAGKLTAELFSGEIINLANVHWPIPDLKGDRIFAGPLETISATVITSVCRRNWPNADIELLETKNKGQSQEHAGSGTHTNDKGKAKAKSQEEIGNSGKTKSEVRQERKLASSPYSCNCYMNYTLTKIPWTLVQSSRFCSQHTMVPKLLYDGWQLAGADLELWSRALREFDNWKEAGNQDLYNVVERTLFHISGALDWPQRCLDTPYGEKGCPDLTLFSYASDLNPFKKYKVHGHRHGPHGEGPSNPQLQPEDIPNYEGIL